MPEMVWLDPEKSGSTRRGSFRRFSVESDHLRDLRHLRNADAAPEGSRVVELATLLARGYLRLAEKSRTSAVSCADTAQIPLEVSGPESPHVGGHEAA